MFGGGGPDGGYIPYLNLPCENFIGESGSWVAFIASAPFLCGLLPFSCCPILEPESIAIDPTKNISCTESGAVYASTLFWTMQGVSILGLVLSLSNLVTCVLDESGQEIKDFPTVALSLDIPSEIIRELDLQQKENPDEKPKLSLSYVKKKIMDVVKKANKDKASIDTYDKNKLKEESKRSLSRVKRQGGNFPIPTLVGHYIGVDDPLDGCGRNEVLVEDDDDDRPKCYQVMSQGPCDLDELVLVNVTTREGYCGERLCGPDRVFLFGDQLCHDPREFGICPPGRILSTSQFGTPVCGCADGYYEEDNDFDDDDCQPILTEIDNCPDGEVFWFKTFKQPPVCRPDPCNGLNIKRPEEELPFVPSLRDGKCYQIGSQPKICRTDQFYSVDMVKLKGVCERLDDAGYTIYNPQDFLTITSQFGKPISKDTTPAFPKLPKPGKPTLGSAEKSPSKQKKRPLTPASTTLIQNPFSPVIGSSVVPAQSIEVTAPLMVGASVVPPLSPIHNLIPVNRHPKMLNLVPTHMSSWSPSFLTVDGSITFVDFSGMTAQPIQHHHRQKRKAQPFASPGNVFEPGFTSCRAGASKDLNSKCRNVVLPSRYPSSRPRRTAPAIRPRTSCRGGSIRGVDRRCGDRRSVSSSINSHGLGR